MSGDLHTTPMDTRSTDTDPQQPTLTLEGAGAPGAKRSRNSLARGDTVGRYVVLEPVGEGGMGAVYAAYDPELDRKVALKLLHRRDAASQDRLVHEAQALARLDHPNVLTVHDVGVVDARVFLTTAYVDGQTVDAWLRAEQPSVQRILEVFRQAGRGLAAAHRAGLVHRDVKPSNLMLTEDGRVLVVDFGLAMADTSGTRPGAVAGTPEYMAPEQLDGGAIDGRADQHSFCVALYRALYGQRPFAHSSSSLARGETPDWTLPEPPRRRVPPKLRQALLRGLAEQPADRHPSMDALLAALSHGERSRTRQAAVAVTVALLAGAAGWGYQRAAAERRDRCGGGAAELATVWNAERVAAIGRAVTGTGRPFAGDVWRSAQATLEAYGQDFTTAHRAACEATTLRGEQSADLLDLRMACLDDRLHELDALAGLLEDDTTAVIDRAADLAGSLSPIADCADIEALLAPVPPPAGATEAEAVAALRDRLARARVHILAGTYDAGGDETERLVEEAESVGYRPLTAEAHLLAARMASARFDGTSASASLTRAIETAAAGRHVEAAAEAFIERVRVAASAGRFDEGRTAAADAAALVGDLGQPDALALALAKNRATLLAEEGAHDEALAEAREALDLAERLRGSDSLDVAYVRTVLGDLEAAVGDLAAAQREHRDALRITESELGPLHPNVALALDRLGSLAAESGDHEAARDVHGRALAIRQQILPPDDVGIALSYLHLGAAALGAGNFAVAYEQLDRGRAIVERALGPDHAYVAVPLINMAVVRAEQGRTEDAVGLYERAMAIREAVYGLEHQEVAQVAFNLGVTYKKADDPAKALPYLERSLAIWEATLPPDHFSRGDALTALGESLLALGRPAEALPRLEAGHTILLAVERRGDFLGTNAFALARTLEALGQEPQRALDLARLAQSCFERAAGVSSRELAAVKAWLAER